MQAPTHLNCGDGVQALGTRGGWHRHQQLRHLMGDVKEERGSRSQSAGWLGVALGAWRYQHLDGIEEALQDRQRWSPLQSDAAANLNPQR